MKNINKALVTVLGVALVLVLGLAGLVRAATAVNLGAADAFSVLAGSAIENANPSVIVSGDVGLSPASGSFIMLTDPEVAGTIYAVDGAGPAGSVADPTLLSSAKSALTTAYNDAAGQPTTVSVTSDLGTFMGGTLTPGVYEDNDAPDSLGLTGTLTLDAGGDPNAVFIFKSGSTLTTAAGSEVVLINGAQACNVFWQIGSSATLGVGSTFKGTILAAASITDNGGSTIEGRLLASSGAVTLDNTNLTKATCVAPPPAPSGGGNNVPTVFPLINVTKIPSPLNLLGGPGPVTYTYTVTNIGAVAMSGVTVNDNKCEPVSFIDGDENNDSMLDLDESWIYRCTKTLEETETNTVTACGSSIGPGGSGTVCDTANATVTVGVPVIPPLIHIVKRPNVFLLPFGGGLVTYSYTVTNPGTEPLHDVSVTDDKCTGLPGRVLGHPGDLNQNNLLESNEVWSFTCLTNLSLTTTNIGTAQGHANGLTAIDFSPATVTVGVPALPDTGIGLDWKNTLWNIVLASGIFAVSIFFYFARKKQRA